MSLSKLSQVVAFRKYVFWKVRLKKIIGQVSSVTTFIGTIQQLNITTPRVLFVRFS
jgi:hypothetical protein